MSREHRRSSSRSRSRSPCRDRRKSEKSNKIRPERYEDAKIPRRRTHEKLNNEEGNSRLEERRERHRKADRHDQEVFNANYDQRKKRDSAGERLGHRQEDQYNRSMKYKNSNSHERENRAGFSGDLGSNHQRRDQQQSRRGLTNDGHRDRPQHRDTHHRRQEGRRRKDASPDQEYKFGRASDEDAPHENEDDKTQPNYALSGKLTEYTNTYKGVVIKYNEPPEARKPKTRWRLYPFKEDKQLDVMYVHRQSAYLIGRQRHIVDIAVDHPSCSKQHAVLQYRLGKNIRPDGTEGLKVKPYIIDLESQNGTYLNNERIEPRRYYEIKEKDVLKFGFSTREYVVLTESSKQSDSEDEGS